MSGRRARRLGTRGPRAKTSRRKKRRTPSARRWILPAVVMLAIVAVVVAPWRLRPLDEESSSLANLSGSERRRSAAPLSADARMWLVQHRDEVRRVAATFEVSPIALGGIVATEKTLLTGRVDLLGDEVVQVVFGSLRDEDLSSWARQQEREYQRRVERGGGRPTLLTPYLWTLGPAQVSLRLAFLYEPAVARRTGRPQRSLKEVLEAVTTVSGNLEYAAALLADAQQAYAEVAGVDITDEPGLLATLYQLGSPTRRARRLVQDNAAREARGAAPDPPRTNWYGAFVDRHADEIAALLDLPETEGSGGG